MKAATTIVTRSLNAIATDIGNERSNIRQVARQIAAYPIKMIAAFFTAPILIARLAIVVKNPFRRTIALVGILLAILMAYIAGTFLGGVAGAIFVMANVGILTGIGFLVGTTLSVFLSLLFSILVLNSVSLLFLKMSTQEIVDYLNDISR